MVLFFKYNFNATSAPRKTIDSIINVNKVCTKRCSGRFVWTIVDKLPTCCYAGSITSINCNLNQLLLSNY